VCELQKYFSHPSLVINFFPTHTKTGPASRRESTSTNAHEPIKLSSQLPALIHSAVPFTKLSKLCTNVGPNSFCSAKPACFPLSHNFYCCSGRGFSIWISPIDQHDLYIQLECMSIPCTQQYNHTKRANSANLGFKTVTPLSTVN
jgi:hypothetical protein